MKQRFCKGTRHCVFHFSLSVLLRCTEHSWRQLLCGKGRGWQLVWNQKHNRPTWSVVLSLGWCTGTLRQRQQNSQFKKQLLNNISACLSLECTLITRQKCGSPLLGNETHIVNSCFHINVKNFQLAPREANANRVGWILFSLRSFHYVYILSSLFNTWYSPILDNLRPMKQRLHLSLKWAYYHQFSLNLTHVW